MRLHAMMNFAARFDYSKNVPKPKMYIGLGSFNEE
jgi:hypothetical protein